MTIVRDNCGFFEAGTETEVTLVSIGTAISGIMVTPMPALTICTSVDKELPSSSSRGRAECRLQKDSVYSRKQRSSSSSNHRISRSIILAVGHRLAGILAGTDEYEVFLE